MAVDVLYKVLHLILPNTTFHDDSGRLAESLKPNNDDKMATKDVTSEVCSPKNKTSMIFSAMRYGLLTHLCRRTMVLKPRWP